MKVTSRHSSSSFGPLFSVTRRSRSDSRQSLTHSLTQGGTICGLSSLASFLKILSSKRVCCVFRDIRDKNAVNQGFWSKTAVFSLPATKVHCFLIFWLPHLYNLLQPGIRKQQKYTSIHEYLYLAINKAKFALLLFQPSHCSRVILEYLRIPKIQKYKDAGLRIED